MMDGSAGRTREKEKKEKTKAVEPLRFSAEDFADAVQLVAPALPGVNTTQPRLEIMEYRGHAALMGRCVDLEVLARIGNAAPVEPMVLPAQAFKKFFRRGKTALDVLMSSNGDQGITVELDGMTAQFAREAVEEWGDPAVMLEAPSVHIERKTLAHALGLCAPAVSTEETRYYLNGICITPHASDTTALIFCATDGHRLVKHVVQGLTHSLDKTIIVPREAVKILRGLLAKVLGDAPVELATSATHVTFSCDEFYLKARLIDGTFPDFERVIPANCPLVAELHASGLRSFLRRAKGLTKERAAVVQLQIQKKDDIIRVAWHNAELGRVTLRLDGHAEADMNVGFNIRYLLDTLDQLRAEHISVCVAGPSAPAMFATAGELADPSTTIVVMPALV